MPKSNFEIQKSHIEPEKPQEGGEGEKKVEDNLAEAIGRAYEQLREVGKNLREVIPQDRNFDIELQESESRINLRLKHKEGATEKEILNLIQTSVEAVFEDKEKLYGAEIMHQVERQIFLITLDSEWKDHLLSLDKLRHGINLRAYAQKDPLIEYKRDALNLFEEMMMRIEEQVASRLAHVQVNIENAEDALNLVARAPKQKMFESRNDPAMANAHEIVSSSSPIKSNVKPEDRDPRDQSTWGNVGRNETCPCGSGKKFKQCHG